MKLSIVVICWNDAKVIYNCLDSIFKETVGTSFEVIVSDNGSTDGSIAEIRKRYPSVRIVENGANLGFAKGNNAGIAVAQGDYVLILNPDTIIHYGALDEFIRFADERPEAGAYGCRVLNPDGSLQISARPRPTVLRELLAALCVRWLGRISTALAADSYVGWNADTERTVDWQSGCCILFQRKLLKQLQGFDERFFYHFEETDLCFRVWKSGAPVLFCPTAKITHLGGQSVGRFPIRFVLETYRSRYRYFYKHYGSRGATQIRWIAILHLAIRKFGYGLLRWFKKDERLENRLAMYRVALKWNLQLDPIEFVKTGQEPDLGYAPLAPTPKLA
ncbi:MAG: glycosyltransferase family 2 protein [Verrucomicrobiota bacterium]